MMWTKASNQAETQLFFKETIIRQEIKTAGPLQEKGLRHHGHS